MIADDPSPLDLPVLTGERLTLRSPRASDVGDRLAIGRHPEVARMYGREPDGRALAHQEAYDWLARLIDHPCAWVIEHAGRAVGQVRLDDIDRHDDRASLAIGIEDAGLLGQGLGVEALHLAIGFAFGPLGLHRLSVRVLEYNTRAIRAYRRCGFVIEGRERQAAHVGEERYDDLIMGLLATEWAASRSE